jgi:hypothetical protein
MSLRSFTRTRRLSIVSAIAAVLCAAALAGPVTAVGQEGDSPSGGGEAAQVADRPAGGSGGEEGSGMRKVIGGLPFTGLDLLALGAVALALGSLGLALRRLAAERDPS